MKRKESAKAARSGMAMVHPNAAAIDIGATMHMAAVGADRTSDPVQSFGAFTGDLHRLADWFAECGVRTVVMESTSVYWIPIFELLDERGFDVFLVNARDAKHVPGRKTDVSDAQWLLRLHSYGLLRASFRPKGEIAELRAYLRQRERLLDAAMEYVDPGASYYETRYGERVVESLHRRAEALGYVMLAADAPTAVPAIS